MFHTKEEVECEVHFQETTRIENDRFVVKLPFKTHSSLAESMPQAKRRFESLERRLNQVRYTCFIDEFFSLNHFFPFYSMFKRERIAQETQLLENV